MATSTASRAKQPRNPLAGPYGHPLHPVLVTVPVGAWFASLVFDLVSRIAEDGAALVTGATWLIGIGILGALVAAAFGFLDLMSIPQRTKAYRTALTHMALNLVVVVLFAVNLGLRQGEVADSVDTIPLVLSLIALAVLGASGWLGGKLAYRFGVRVADDETQAEGFVERTR
jgi:uncharacterized membrane protein